MISARRRDVDRRTMLTRGGMAMLGLGLSGCATRGTRMSSPARVPVRLAPVHVSWDRVIRTTVGLRPHRPQGFVLRAGKSTTRPLIHNYGHGGSGMSLSWGTGAMAADLALAHHERRAAVIGCGVVGFTAARQLQRRGFDVTIYAASVPPDTTSNMSLAGFTPTSGLYEPIATHAGMGRTVPPGGSHCLSAAAAAGGSEVRGVVDLQLFADSTMPNVGARRQPADAGRRPHRRRCRCGPGEHPFPSTLCDPATGNALRAVHLSRGADAGCRRCSAARSASASLKRADLVALERSVIVNCTGLGAKALFGDPDWSRSRVSWWC